MIPPFIRIISILSIVTPILHSSPLDDHKTLTYLDQLGSQDADLRYQAHLALHKALISDPDESSYFDTLTLFYKQAPKLCRIHQNELQTLHILHIFAAQRDISSVLLKESLNSKFESVQRTALQFAHYSDNSIQDELLRFHPTETTLSEYKSALLTLGTQAAILRHKQLN